MRPRRWFYIRFAEKTKTGQRAIELTGCYITGSAEAKLTGKGVIFVLAQSRSGTRSLEQRLASMEKPRQVVRKFLARPQYEGVGAVVRRSIGR
jgi:hypothetical protein